MKPPRPRCRPDGQHLGRGEAKPRTESLKNPFIFVLKHWTFWCVGKNKMFFLKQKKLIILAGVIFVSFLVVLIWRFDARKVSAQVIPVLVQEEHLDFGTVFPGENLQGKFTVYYVENYEENGVIYRIIQKRKPLPENHPEYPDGGDPEMPGYYRNLCPFLTKATDEGEGDTENEAFVGPGDASDTWIIYFQVPAIVGNVSQDHIGGVVTSNGEYGCDVSIDIDYEPCNPELELVINGGFEEPVVATTQKWDIYNTSQLPGWTVEWVSAQPPYNGYSQPTEGYLELHRLVVAGWNPQEGSQYAELDSDWFGPSSSVSGEPASAKIYQDLTTVPGQEYTIKFYFSPRPNTGSTDNILEFKWDGMVKDTISLAGGSATNWLEKTYNFTATNSITRLEFADKGTQNSLGTFLDNVSVRCRAVQP